MKRLIVYLCTGMALVSLAACGNGDKAGDSQSSSAGSQTEGSAAAGDQTGGGGQTASGTGDQSVSGLGAADPAQGATAGDSGHDYETGWTEEMAGIKEAVLEQAGDDYFPNMPLMPDMLEAQFGITSDMYDDYFAEMPMISANVDTLLIIKAKDGKVEDVEAALEAYRDVQINGTMQYPANVGIVQASRIETIGNYVCFSQLGGDVMDLMDSGDEAVILHCQELNDLVIGIVRDKVQ
ncbi:MAG: DUF4358 domain-containing protein [Eubacterium sp.]|nr:DUF4358 domain-containing protein [Eubacterium sp.]MCM1303584.1 DUF4358 domain-containing protein [Butyrivibrio sp.]MCM1343308.1 DUF4358 domain-containing protein [Muribaculaceae bacterium]MCM1409340.1 DUF4358 domain-containing protein [Lachnospiraceae bacterium]